MTDQGPGIYRRRVGDFIVTALNDGYLDAPLGLLQGIEPEAATALLLAGFRAPAPRLTVHTFLVQGGGQTVLIDTGAGANFGPTCGRLLANLAAAGVTPGDIDLVLLTHLHGDHVGGLANSSGGAVFPKARVAMPAVEAEFWLDQSLDSFSEDRRGSVTLSHASLAPYANRLSRLTDTTPVLGITPVPLPGHTPGHTGYRIHSGDDALLIWADIVHVPAVQVPRPEVTVGFDLDPAQAVASRRRILAQAADDRLLVAGMHLDFPCFCHVARQADSFRLVPEQWVPLV